MSNPRTADLALIHGDHRHTTGISIAEQLRAIASRVALAGDIAEVAMGVELQVVSAPHSAATDDYRAATVDVLAELLDVPTRYGRQSGHYGIETLPIRSVHVFGAMRPPARVLAAAWDEAHAEKVEREAAQDSIAIRDELEQAWDCERRHNACHHADGMAAARDCDHEAAKVEDAARAALIVSTLPLQALCPAAGRYACTKRAYPRLRDGRCVTCGATHRPMGIVPIGHRLCVHPRADVEGDRGHGVPDGQPCALMSPQPAPVDTEPVR